MKTSKAASRTKIALAFGLAIAGLSSFSETRAVTPPGQRLRTLGDATGILMGNCINIYTFYGSDPADYKETAGEEYSSMTSETSINFADIEPSQNSFSYNSSDQLQAFAASKNSKFIGHTLIWYYGNPSWVTGGTWTATTLTNVMYNHLDNVIGHYKGKAYAWTVVNEAFDASKSNSDWKLNLRTGNNIWNDIIGPTYIEKAFQRARAADPATLLIYNDYDQEVLNNKSNSMYNMVVDFQNRSIPLDGVGFQCHWAPGTPGSGYVEPDYASFASNLDRFSKLGTRIYITEFDVVNYSGSDAGTPSLGNDLEARIYYNCLDKCLRCPAVEDFITWGFTDASSWRNYQGNSLPGYALPFDKNYVAKPAYYALQDALSTQFRSELTTNGGFENGLTGWGSNGNGTVAATTSQAHSGTQSVGTTGRTASWGGPVQSTLTTLTAQGAGRYYLGAWIKFSTGTGTGRITLRTVDSTGVTQYFTAQGTIGTGWTHVSGWVNVAWSKTLTASSIYVDTPGSTADFYVDDMRAGDSNVLSNGNFENGITGWTAGGGAAISASTAQALHHYGLGAVADTGRGYTSQGPRQDILATLQAQGSGNYNFETYLKLATGSATGKITVRLTYGGSDHYLTGASGSITSAQWTKVASSAPINITWTGPLTAALLYIETPGTTADFYADEIVMRQ